MNRIDQYRQQLKNIPDWESFLRAESGLPGARGNLELAQAAAEEGEPALLEQFLAYTPAKAPENTAGVFVAFCGVLGLGKQAASGNRQALSRLRSFASDPRWRIREAVAMALQRLGDEDMPNLLQEMQTWSVGNLLEKRAAAAALCEPRLLKHAEDVRAVLEMLDQITASLIQLENRKGEDFLALKKGLGYCWSVAVAALPEIGKPYMEKWFPSQDKDIRWIMRENLKKQRLIRSEADWVTLWSAALSSSK